MSPRRGAWYSVIIIAAGAWAGQAGAIPAGLQANGMTETPSAPLVQKVHGDHRSCRWYHGWLHRHVGRHDRAVSCRYYRYYGPYYDGSTIRFRFGDHDRRRFRHHDRDHHGDRDRGPRRHRD